MIDYESKDNNTTKYQIYLLYPKQNNIYEKYTPSVDNYKDFNRTKFFFVGSVLIVNSNTISEHFVSDFHFFLRVLKKSIVVADTS